MWQNILDDPRLLGFILGVAEGYFLVAAVREVLAL
jgi:hypothetical protein